MIKTNIKMRVTPEQSAKVQEICFKNDIDWTLEKGNVQFIDKPFLFIDEYISFMYEEEAEDFLKEENEEVDADLFIRTNGTCIEKREAEMKHNDKMENLKEWEDTAVKQDLVTDINNKAKNPNSKHYELWENFEAIDIIKLVLTDEEYKGFLKGNILKYRLRVGKKDDVSKEIEKIKDYQRELNK